jgi:hypothetical protein
VKQLEALGKSQEAEPRWDERDPRLLYHLRGMKLMTLNVVTGRERTVRDFSRDFPRGTYLMTGSEGDASVDRRTWCFMVKDKEWAPFVALMYDREADKILGVLRNPPTKIDNISASMLGQHCVIGYDNGDGVVHGRDMRRIRTMQKGGVGHSDFALTAGGRDVLVYQNSKTDFIAMHDLETGQETNLVAIPFEKNTDIGIHVSGNNVKMPGWAMVSTYGARNPPAGKGHSWMDLQLFMVELKARPRIWRVVSTFSILSLNPDGEKHYFAEAFAAINRRGTRLYWGANWAQRDLDQVELFMAVLPDRWPTLVPAARR